MGKQSWYALILILILIIVGAFVFYSKTPGYQVATTTTSTTTTQTTSPMASTTTTSQTTTSVMASDCNSVCIALNYSSGFCRASCFATVGEKSVTAGSDCLSFQKCCCKK